MTELPGGTFVLTAETRRRFAEAVLGDPDADPSVDALWIFTSGLPGMGTDLVEVFASVGCSTSADSSTPAARSARPYASKASLASATTSSLSSPSPGCRGP